MDDIIVSVSLLTAGKKKELEKCLLSLQPLLQAVSSELIIVDTGCDAEHRRLVEKYADKVVDFVWCDDFAKARNAGLELARGKWFLFLDDDEWFEDMSEIIDFFRTGEYKNYDYAMYKVRNYKDRAGKRYTDDPAGRLIRLRADTRFQYTIHEVFNHTGERLKFFDTYVHHYGYVYDTEEDKARHAKRNIVPLLREMEREPDNLRHPLQLMQEYAVLKEHGKVIALGRQVTENFEDSGTSQIFYYNSIAVLLLKEIIQEANAEEQTGTQPTDEPEDKTDTQPTDEPEDKTDTQPADEPEDKTGIQPADEPEDKTGTQPADEPAEQTGTQPADAREMFRTLVREGEAFLRSGYIAPLAEAYIKALLVFGYRECGEYERAVRYTEDYLRHLSAYRENREEYVMFLSPITEACFGRNNEHATLENGIMAALKLGNIRQAREWNERLGWQRDEDFQISELFLTTALEALSHAAPEEWEDAETMCNLLLTRGVVADFVREYAERQLQELSAGEQGLLPLLAGLSPREWFSRQNEEVRRAGLTGQQSEPESSRQQSEPENGERLPEPESEQQSPEQESEQLPPEQEGRLQEAILRYAAQQLAWGGRLQSAVPQRTVPYLESDAYRGAVAAESFYSLLEAERYGEAAAELRELLRRKPDWQAAVRCCAALLQRRVREQKPESTGAAQNAEAQPESRSEKPESTGAAQNAEVLPESRSAKPESAASAATSENAEFAALAVAVKRQVGTMLQTGHTKEAQGVLLQLQTMLPEDAEIKELLRQIAENC